MLDKILQVLMFNKRIKPAQLARDANIPKQTLSRIISGKSPKPHIKNLQPIADYFEVSLAQLRGDVPLPSGMVELDVPTDRTRATQLPIYQWRYPFICSSPDDLLYAAPSISEQAFALRMPDTSMAPIFAPECILMFEPSVEYGDRDFVLVRFQATQQLIFRQLLVDAEQHYAKALSPDLKSFPMRLLEPKDSILGVLVESRQNFTQHVR
jgi:transcriptional regulator with XRE-family HTH domain